MSPPRRPVKFPAEFCFTAEHMTQLDGVIKLLARSPGGLTAQEVDSVAGALTRLRNGVVIEARRQLAADATPEVTPVPFRAFRADDPDR
jgi:hypothetical protein